MTIYDIYKCTYITSSPPPPKKKIKNGHIFDHFEVG